MKDLFKLDRICQSCHKNKKSLVFMEHIVAINLHVSLLVSHHLWIRLYEMLSAIVWWTFCALHIDRSYYRRIQKLKLRGQGQAPKARAESKAPKCSVRRGCFLLHRGRGQCPLLRKVLRFWGQNGVFTCTLDAKFRFLCAKAALLSACLSHHNSVRPSVRPSVCHTGGSGKNGAS